MAHDDQGVWIGAQPDQLAGGIQERYPRSGHERPSVDISAMATAIERNDSGNEHCLHSMGAMG
jgi:hypothetical protein